MELHKCLDCPMDTERHCLSRPGILNHRNVYMKLIVGASCKHVHHEISPQMKNLFSNSGKQRMTSSLLFDSFN